MAETIKPTTPEPQKPPVQEEHAGASKPSDEAREIKKARETIKNLKEEATQKQEMKHIRTSARPPKETPDEAKTLLKASPTDKIKWLVPSPDDVISSEVAVFAAHIAESGNLQKNPEWLTVETLRLACSVRSASDEARKDVSAAVYRIRDRVKELAQAQPESIVDARTFDELVYGSELVPASTASEKVFDDEKPDEETITDPELIKMLREIDRKIRTDPAYLADPRYLEQDIAFVRQAAQEKGISEQQTLEAIKRLREIQGKVTTKIISESEEGHRHNIITYEEFKKYIPEEDRVEPIAKEFAFKYLTPEEIESLRNGEIDKFFYEFVSGIYSMGRTAEHPAFPDEYKFMDFTDFMRWAHPKNIDYYFDRYKVMWGSIQINNQVIKNLLYTPGSAEEKLKNLRFVTGADLDHYMKNYDYANYAESIYDQAVKDNLAKRRRLYQEALTYIQANENKALGEYKDLIDKRERGELIEQKDMTPQQKDQLQKDQLLLMELQRKVDLVGYGVALWDEDIQNYMELDFEVNIMSQELDKLKQKEGDKPQDLTKDERERMDRLEAEIAYKQRSRNEAEQREGYGPELREKQHKNKGLSIIDIEAKERLRGLLKDRFPKEEIPEWKLNRAVWAAKQHQIASGRLMSTAAYMAIMPNKEYFGIFKDYNIDIGKYVMKAPAFEDIVRIYNPGMFSHRFGMGDRVGDIFESILDVNLLEKKGFKFENDRKDQRPEDKKLNYDMRRAKQFIRQVERKTNVPYSELVLNGFFQAGGNYDQTTWRAQIAILDQIRLRYMDMQKRGELRELGADAQFDNQGLSIQYAMLEKDDAGRKPLFKKMVQRDPSILFQLCGGDFDGLVNRLGDDKQTFLRALSQASINTWDVVGQHGENRFWAFRNVELLTNRAHFDALVKPFLKGVSEDRVGYFFEVLKSAKGVLDENINDLVKLELPLTISLSDFDWKDVRMFDIGTIGVDRRARDMWGMAQARDVWLGMRSNPEILFSKDPKKTLAELKKYRDLMNTYTPGKYAELATDDFARVWIEMNRNRRIHIEVREFTPLAPLNAVGRSVMEWVPFYDIARKILQQVDMKNNIFNSKKIEKWPNEIAESVSYARRYTGPSGNAFEERELDEILDLMLQMGIFNADEDLYHGLRRKYKAGLGNQLVGMVRKYWWLLPILTTVTAAKQSIDEEKKSSAGY